VHLYIAFKRNKLGAQFILSVFCQFYFNHYMFQTSLCPSSGGTTVRHPTRYTSWIVSMNTAPLETLWRYSNISTNHHISYHTNSYTYNYSIITINSSQNNTLMNKILCSNYFTIDITHHTTPDIPINNSISTWHNQFHSILHTRQSAIEVLPLIYQLSSYCIFCSSFIYFIFNIVTYVLHF